jgi:phosphate acetyltransferase
VVKEKAVSTTPTPHSSSERAKFEKHQRYQRLIVTAKSLERMLTAVAHPCDQSSLEGAINAAEMGLISPILIGPEAKIAGVAQKFKLDISPYECVDVPHSHAAAAKAVEIVRAGRAEALMKGSLHTDELMGAVCAVAALVAAARRKDVSKVIA